MSLLQPKPGQTPEQIKKQGYVTYIYERMECNVPNVVLECADCPGEVLDYIKEVYGSERRLRGLKCDSDDEFD